MNELVKYHNELNTVPFKNFTSREMNLFFSIVSRMRDKGLEKVRFDFSELIYLSDYKETALERFMNDLESTYDKMLHLKATTRSNLYVHKFVLFTDFEIFGKEQYVDIAVNPSLKSILNELDAWTRFSLRQFNSLHSTYAKTLFRLLKQYRTTGRLELSMEDFREQLDVPESYKTPSQIDQKVMTPIKKELHPFFPGLTITKKKSKKRGNKVLGYIFTFQKENKNADDFVKIKKENLSYQEIEITTYGLEKKQLKKNENEATDERERFEAMLAERRQKKSSQS